MKKKIAIVVLGIMFSWHGFSQSIPEGAVKRSQLKYQKALQFNDFVEAKSALYDLMVLEPNNYSYLDSLAYMYYEFNQYASSALVSQEALKHNSQNQIMLEIAGQSFKKLGVADKSLQMFQKLYDLSDDMFILYEVAMLQLQVKKYSDAMISAELLMGKPLISNNVTVKDKEGKDIQVPFKAVIFNLQGTIEKAQGSDDSAIKYFNNALKLAPNYALAQENLNTLK